MSLIVNGRFLGIESPTGVQRVARSLLAAARIVSPENFDVLAPIEVLDPLVDRHVGSASGRARGLVWEQVILTTHARRRTVMSLANTGPVAAASSVLLVHDLAPLLEPQWFHRRMQIYARLSLLAARRADLVIAVSDHVAEVLASRGVRHDRIAVVRPCVDPSFGPATPESVASVRRRWAIEGPYFVHVGASDPRKNAAMLIEAHRLAVMDCPHTLVLIGGAHPNLATVEPVRLSTLRYTGRVDDDDLRALLTGAVALAYPSLEEGFGLPPVEAQACGTPALVSDIPALRESAGPTAVRLPPHSVRRWADGLVAALNASLPPPTFPTRTWADAASELVGVLASSRLDWVPGTQ